MSRVVRRLAAIALTLGVAHTAMAQTTVRYVHTDALGSVVAMTDQNRVVVERREHEPYGQQLTALEDGPGYTGHVQDAASGLTYMQQRYFDPIVGQFLSVDPVTADVGNVDHFHRYRYANGNPYGMIDPDGRAPIANTCSRAGGQSCSGNYSLNLFPQPSKKGGSGEPSRTAGPASGGEQCSIQRPQTTHEAAIRNAIIRGDKAELHALLNEGGTLSASDMAIAQRALAALEGLSAENGAMLASRYGLDWANRVNHIFQGAHQGPVGNALLRQFGSPSQAMVQVQRAVELAKPAPGLIGGRFGTTVNVGGHSVEVRGAVVDGVYKIATVLKW